MQCSISAFPDSKSIVLEGLYYRFHIWVSRNTDTTISLSKNRTISAGDTFSTGIACIELQADHLFAINNTEKHLSGTLWSSAIIKEVWSHWQLVWDQRNNAIHGHDETSSGAARRCGAEIMLHEIYSRKGLMKPSDRNKILFDDIEHNITKTTNQIMNWWISVHKPLVCHSIKETDRLAIRGSKLHSDLLPYSTDLTRSACGYILSLTHFGGSGARLEIFSLGWQPRQS